jgi:hypothetical protein
VRIGAGSIALLPATVVASKANLSLGCVNTTGALICRLAESWAWHHARRVRQDRALLADPAQQCEHHYVLYFFFASALTGVKKLIRFSSGSRNSRERFPQGCVVGS